MIPLDIIWMDAGGNVLFVSANTPPCKSDPCPTYGPDTPAPVVLELAGGLADEGRRPGRGDPEARGREVAGSLRSRP